MPAERARILVVDDEPELRDILRLALEDLPLQIDSAGSGEEALALAQAAPPDLVVTDICLGDCNGLDVIDRLRSGQADLPAVVITGRPDAQTVSAAGRRHPVEFFTKPLDLDRLRCTVSGEIAKLDDLRRNRQRQRRLRQLARDTNRQRKQVQHELQTTCSELAESYRRLSGQIAHQQVAMAYQRELLGARNDDDVFRAFFRTVVKQSGPVFGIAMVCNADAELQIVGRFGVPAPDGPAFCEQLTAPVIEGILKQPVITEFDAGERCQDFAAPIRKYLCGLSVLAVPLLPQAGELIGLVVLYRKGEQPFLASDNSLVENLAVPTAIAVRRND